MSAGLELWAGRKADAAAPSVVVLEAGRVRRDISLTVKAISDYTAKPTYLAGLGVQVDDEGRESDTTTTGSDWKATIRCVGACDVWITSV